MSNEDLFHNIRNSTKQNHFANLVNIASIDGDIKPSEQELLKRFAKKFDVDDESFEKILENPSAFPVHAINSKSQRLEFLFDLLKIVYADHIMDVSEEHLIIKYAVGLGYSDEQAASIIQKSKRLFENRFSFDFFKHYIDSKDE